MKSLYLSTQLAKAHPEESVRPPPPKDRTMGTAPSQQPMSSPPSEQSASPKWNGDSMSDENLAPSRLAREKNRLTLRAYLHSLLSSVVIASSPVLRSFLLSGPTTLSPEELDDAKRREEADNVREDGRKRFAKEIASRVEGLRDAVKSVKGDVMGKGTYEEISKCDRVHFVFRWTDAHFRNNQGDAEYSRSSPHLSSRH